jgi:TetR/AcrR family transcriptional regulator, tetracycline repressor protein
MTTRPRLTREHVIEAIIDLIDGGRPEELSLRHLGTVLGVDPTAIYRHFRDKDDLMRAVGDRILANVMADLPPPTAPWRDIVVEMCCRLRAAHLSRPGIASFLKSGPPQLEHELRHTEALLFQLRRAGIDDRDAVLAYHALIELAAGSAVLDATMVTLDAIEREAVYESWRAAYGALDPDEFPVSVEMASRLYPGCPDHRYLYALERLLDGIEASAAQRSRDHVPAN